MAKLIKKEYSVKDYAKLKSVSIPAVYKAIREKRIDFTKKFGVYVIID